MKSRLLSRLTCKGVSIVLLCGLLSWVGDTALAGPIGPGFDLFSTPPGGGILPLSQMIPGAADVPLVGMPIGPGNTDTIVQRRTGLPDGGTGVIETEIVALSLMSIAPVNIMGSFFDVFVTLDPLMRSGGQVIVTGHGTGGGTFDSFFDVFTEITFTEVGNPMNRMVVPRQDQLTSMGSMWSHDPPPAYPQDPRYPPGGFYPGPIDHTGPHPHTDPASPEPGSALLLVIGGLGLGLVGRVRRP